MSRNAALWSHQIRRAPQRLAQQWSNHRPIPQSEKDVHVAFMLDRIPSGDAIDAQRQVQNGLGIDGKAGIAREIWPAARIGHWLPSTGQAPPTVSSTDAASHCLLKDAGKNLFANQKVRNLSDSPLKSVDR
jgi:hypothetical protein